jgi:Ni/Co efflux regulator RcnB
MMVTTVNDCTTEALTGKGVCTCDVTVYAAPVPEIDQPSGNYMTTNPLKSPALHSSRSFAFLLAATLACSASFADKPEWAGKNGKGGKHEQSEHEERGDRDGDHGSKKGKKHKGGDDRQDVRVGGYFVEQQRVVVHNYYGEQFRTGHCPPGLAKKHNGCMPPGQAKKYAIGQPLPQGVIYYPVPAPVLVQLGTPPSGYRYVRVASDILLITLGSSMVVDAIQDLSRL